MVHLPKDMIVNEISLVIQNKVPKNKNKDKETKELEKRNELIFHPQEMSHESNELFSL
jgi:hypothetical protein